MASLNKALTRSLNDYFNLLILLKGVCYSFTFLHRFCWLLYCDITS